MSKEIYISSTPHETRLAITESDELSEMYYERENEYTLAGSIYNGRVTRVLPGMQSAFVDVGLERDAFLYITDFLEEAADSAEFEGEGRGRSGDNRRGGRERGLEGDGREVARGAAETDSRGSGRDRNGRRRRGGRDERPQQGSDFGRTESAVAGDAYEGGFASATYQSGGDLRLPAEPVEEFGRQELDAPEPVRESSPEGDETETGEGSRRWRGRRGRRRGGRLDAQDAPQGGAQDTQPQAGAGFGTPEALVREERFEVEGNRPDPSSGYDLRESQAGRGLNSDDTVDEAGRRDAADAEGAGRRSREGRGGRERRSGGGDRAMRAPRGFAPRHNLYLNSEPAAENAQPLALDAAGDEGAAAAEPTVLPGESISRYRRGEQTPAAAKPTAEPVAPAPRAAAPDFHLAGSWDGGAVLPGETLRPRAPRPEGEQDELSSAGRGEGRGDDRHESRGGRGRDNRRDGRRDGRGRDDRRRRDGRDERGRGDGSRERSATTRAPQGFAPSTSRGAARGGESFASAEETGPARAGEPRSSAPSYEPREERAERPRQARGNANDEYEPTEGSASLRFDPQPPRSFRQPAGEPGLPPEQQQGEGLESAEDSFADTGVVNQDVTTVSAEGDMLSTPPVSEAAQGAELATELPALEPIEHETAVLETEVAPMETAEAQADVDEQDATETEEGAQTVQVEAALDFFEDPLDGDAEDFDTTLHAASIEEMDEEEEALEGAADLGSMLQEMSIDEMTRPEPEIAEDEFAFEEEDSLEDPVSAFSGSGDGQPLAAQEGQSREGRSGEDAAGGSRRRGRDRRGGRGRSGEDRGGRGSSRPAELAEDRPRSITSGFEEPAGRGEFAEERAYDDRPREERTREQRPREERRGERHGRDDRGYRPGRREGHRSAQVTNLPAISDLLKPGQEVLVQIAKEPIAKKGARITSHIALPGRFLVFMPTVNHTGVSRKIESDGERRRLKEILLSEKGEATGGFIVRTAAAGATEEELRSDLRFLLNLWADIKQRSDSSKSPALIYHDLNLVERILRDQVGDNFSAIWVDTESEYERVLRFLQRFQPSLIRRVKLYTKETPLFEQFGITEEINKALRSKVWLKSGGSIVINQTEALVAIDINTGKYVGKTARLEDTIVKTNLDAIPEIVRQIRLRDLGGIIIIDFIDMDERKNRHRVMAALEEELKKDRAPSKVLQFNDFGLVAITRKRVKQSLERTLSVPCTVCTGTGMVKSPVTVCNEIFVEMRKMHKHLDRGDIMLRVNPEIVKQLKAPNTRWLQEMEELAGRTILVKSDPTLHPEQFDIH